jgi:hypothetical protein
MGRGGSNPPRHATYLENSKAPEAIFGLRGSRSPGFPLGSSRSPSDDLGGFGRRLVVGVAFDVRCDRDARVSELVRHEVRSGTRSEREGGVRIGRTPGVTNNSRSGWLLAGARVSHRRVGGLWWRGVVG